MKRYLAIAAMMIGFGAYAQYDESFMFDEIEIDGQYSDRESAAERMKKMRAKLEERNEMMVKRRIENVRLQQEKEMMKKIQQSMNQTFKALDNSFDNM